MKLLNYFFSFRSLHLVVFWILFENTISLNRAKATIIGLLETSRVNEWIVTEKLGNALNEQDNKGLEKLQFKIGNR